MKRARQTKWLYPRRVLFSLITPLLRRSSGEPQVNTRWTVSPAVLKRGYPKREDRGPHPIPSTIRRPSFLSAFPSMPR